MNKEFAGPCLHTDLCYGNGNLISVSDTVPVATFTWNAENRLVQATRNGVTESYLYDADGARVKRSDGGTVTYTFFPGYEEENGVVVRHYAFAGMAVALRRGEGFYFLHGDHLGSIVVQTDEYGNGSQGVKTFQAHGEEDSNNPSFATDRNFTGQKRDGTDLLYYNARYYDPTLGIFLSPDTIVPEPTLAIDYNRYLYARADPLNLVDPSGHCAVLADGSPDTENDSGCWEAADEWYATFGSGEQSYEEWFLYFASASAITEDVLRSGLRQYWAPLYRDWDIWHVEYNPAPTWNEPPEQSVFDLTEFCSTRDCVAVGIDGVGVVSSGIVVFALPICGAAAPICGTVGTGVSRLSAAVGLIRTFAKRDRPQGPNVDTIVTAATTEIGYRTKNPKVSLAVALAQLIWDSVVSQIISQKIAP